MTRCNMISISLCSSRGIVLSLWVEFPLPPPPPAPSLRRCGGGGREKVEKKPRGGGCLSNPYPSLPHSRVVFFLHHQLHMNLETEFDLGLLSSLKTQLNPLWRAKLNAWRASLFFFSRISFFLVSRLVSDRNVSWATSAYFVEWFRRGQTNCKGQSLSSRCSLFFPLRHCLDCTLINFLTSSSWNDWL